MSTAKETRRKKHRRQRQRPDRRAPSPMVSPPEACPVPPPSRRDCMLMVILLIVVSVLTSLAHAPCLGARALSIDDYQYLVHNELVKNPSWNSTGRFLGEILEPSTVQGYYQPLAMISLMLDHAAGGRSEDPRMFHRTSLALHLMNTALIVVLLWMLFRQPIIAALVGLCFGVHPMTVESIAWIAERKTTLSTFFALWCLILHVRYSRRAHWRRYGGCMIAYVLALMAKPTSTPLPLLLLLLDWWPLRRLNRRAAVEKLPLLAVGCVFAVVTVISQGRTASVTMPGEREPFEVLLLLCHNIIFYLWKMIWPAQLTSFYPFPSLSLSQPMVLAGVVGTCVLLFGLLASLRWTRAFLTGWLFFFVGILPTMGVIGFTVVVASDKYAYLPSIGLLIALAWLVTRLWESAPDKLGKLRAIILVAAALLLSAEAYATRRYLRHWKNTETLYRHMLSFAPEAPELHLGLANALDLERRRDEAVREFRETIRLSPDHARAHFNLGTTLYRLGKIDEAIACFEKALQFDPDHAKCHTNLGNALKQKGKLDEAIGHFKEALQHKPDLVAAHYNMAGTLLKLGRLGQAISGYQRALELDPDHFKAHSNLGTALKRQGNVDEAANHYREALRLNPRLLQAHSSLAGLLSDQGRFAEAIEHYRTVLRLEPNYPRVAAQLEAAEKALLAN